MLWKLSQVTGRSLAPKLNAHSLLRRYLSSSFVEGSSHPPLLNSTLGNYFARNVIEKYPYRPALICREELPRSNGGPRSRNLGVSSHLAWDYSEFDANITAVTRGLLRMGVKKGDRVGVIIPNLSAFATLQWACARMGEFHSLFGTNPPLIVPPGAILVTLNPAYRMHEFVSYLF